MSSSRAVPCRTVAELEQSAEKQCDQAILVDLPGPASMSDSRVYGQWAQIRLGGDTVFLASSGG